MQDQQQQERHVKLALSARVRALRMSWMLKQCRKQLLGIHAAVGTCCAIFKYIQQWDDAAAPDTLLQLNLRSQPRMLCCNLLTVSCALCPGRFISRQCLS
jgi:hypothetical protein